jgi:hypothetical protein
MLRIIANGVDLDLYPDSDFYITKQIHDLNDLNTRNGDITKVLTIPKTGHNERTLKAYYHDGGSREPFDGINSTVVYDGVELIQNALLYWDNITDKTIDIRFFNANTELFNSLGEMLSDLDLSSYDWEFTRNNASIKKNTTTGIIFARCDWMNIESSRFLRDEPTTQWAQSIDINLSGFHFYVATLIEEIITQAGFTLNTDDLNSDLFDTLALAVPVTQFAQPEAATVSGLSSNTAGQSLSAGTTIIEYNNLSAVGVTWNGTPDFEFVVATNTNVEIEIVIRGTFFRVGSGLGSIELINGSDVIHSEELSSSGGFYFSFKVTSGSEGSGSYYVRAVIDGSSYGEIDNSSFEIVSIGGADSRDIIVSNQMPKLSQADFLKGILAHQNIILKTNPITKEVSLLSFNDIKANSSQDWSEKLLLNYDIVQSNEIGSYGRKNNFIYKEFEDQVKTGIDNFYAFDDSRLQKYSDVVELPFEASDDSARYDNTTNNSAIASVFDCTLIEPTPTITGATGTNTFTSSFVGSMNLGDFINVGGDVRRVTGLTGSGGTVDSSWSITHTTAAFTIYRFKAKERLRLHNIKTSSDVAYITDGNVSSTTYSTIRDATFNSEMYFANLIDTNYSNIMAALNRPMVLNAYFIFDLFEFSNIDLFKPVYIAKYNALFFINKINQYRPNKPVMVELIRL